MHHPITSSETAIVHITLDIIYSRYYDFNGHTVTIGGVQTYITQLACLTSEIGFDVRILQCAEHAFQKTILNNVTLIGLPVAPGNPDRLYKAVTQTRNTIRNYISLFATDSLIPSQKVPNSIAIQHGISWDMPSNRQRSFLRSFLSKSILAYKLVKRLHNVDEVVCVDHNFICWHRTQLHERATRLIPILNFTAIGPTQPPRKDSATPTNIVFARRLFPYRGTRIFAEAISRILREYPNVHVTIAGDGPDEQLLKQFFAHIGRVTFTQYSAEDSITFHLRFDIAVIPTTGSEGTSLSLLEAMAAHCAVVCTNVGGMTNIVIDHYNGIMVMPEADALYQGIKTLLDDKALRHSIAAQGYNTVCQAFSIDRWKKRWIEILQYKTDTITKQNYQDR